MPKKGTAPGIRLPAALVSVAALALAAVGCGGGGPDSGAEAAARKKLEAGAAKIQQARSLRISMQFELEEDGRAEEGGCLSLAVDTGKPERFDLSYFDLNCAGGSEGHEVIAVGNRAWASSEPGRWTAAKIAPDLLHELNSEQTDMSKLFAAAEHIEAAPGGAAVEEGDGRFVNVTRYSFEAPAAAFPGSSGDVEDLTVELEAALDRHGYLRELVVHGDEDGNGATVTDKYDDIDEDLEIAPPDPADVRGPVTTIHSRDELEALFGSSASY
ncbi:MAG: hypothetical protein JST08_08875 [Actinobacteria bacterium]|nr:hypothetical protein [Actinomycetota bacterium]